MASEDLLTTLNFLFVKNHLGWKERWSRVFYFLMVPNIWLPHQFRYQLLVVFFCFLNVCTYNIFLERKI